MSYNVINDFGLNENANSLSVDYYWVLAVFRLQYPATYDRSNQKSFSSEIPKGVSLKDGSPLIIIDDCQAVSVQSSKNNHVGSLSASLLPGKEYLSLINPGDYVMCWMVNDVKYLKAVVKRLKEGRSANSFASGLKFFGRINSVREKTSQSPSGPRQTKFTINANSFTELDATLFYERHLATLPEGLDTQIKKMGFDLNKLVDLADGQRGVVPNKMIVSIIDVLLGTGVPANFSSGDTEPTKKSTFGLTGDYAHILPAAIGNTLGKIYNSGSVLRTSDVLEVVHGVQVYENSQSKQTTLQEIGKSFNTKDTNPKNFDSDEERIAAPSRRFTGIDLLGRNNPIPPAVINKSVWAVCNDYLNPACNEMYATLRVNPLGKIVPTVTVRQIPFSTEKAPSELVVTKFLSLPRWIVPPILVKDVDIGRSDALRINFIHVYGVSDVVDARNITQQMVIPGSEPRLDEIDIARSGLRPYMTTVNCWVDETRGDGNKDGGAKTGSGPAKWMALIQDYLMGGHMTLTGSLVMHGIQSPICPGDNLEWGGAVYHIESVSHNCSISSGGEKSFTTSVSLTNGVAKENSNKDLVTEVKDLAIYSRVNPEKPESEYLTPNNSDSLFDEDFFSKKNGG